MDNQDIVDYIYNGPQHQRKKVEVRRHFRLKKDKFRSMLAQITWHYLVYENDTGREIGLLGKDRFEL